MASTPVWFGQLLSNEASTLSGACDLLVKYIDNILAHPDQPKYRCIRLENATFKSRVLSARGSLGCMQAMGFDQDPDYIVLPKNADLLKLQAMRQSLVQRAYVTPQASPAAAVFRPTVAVSAESTRTFLQRVASSSEHVLVYEDRALQHRARSCIPVARLERAASEAVRRVVEAAPAEADGISHQECLLLELLHWFKEDFFKWCDAPECGKCGAPPAQMQSVGHVPPSSDDLRYAASVVEGYRCSACGSAGRFPRYNHPGKLLETRKGRCGEWANCFTLCCRAVGFEARHVVDWTDHVWTEVFSERQHRWLHCDPCEDCCDKPLLYEAGWGKELTYVLAFGAEDAVDVTRRYTARPDDVAARRTACDEEALRRQLDGLRTQRRRPLADDRRRQLTERDIIEAVELLSVKAGGSGDDIAGHGRTSGSMAWRLARGETSTAAAENGAATAAATAAGAGQAAAAVLTAKTDTCYIFEPSAEDVSAGRMRVRYSAASDAYFRQHADGLRAGSDEPVLHGWKAGIFMADNVQRKVENDWKMAYLARRVAAAKATASWTLDLSASSCVVAAATARLSGDVFASGVLTWCVSGDNGCVLELDRASHSGRLDGLAGASMLTVTATLSGGDGDVAWQHTQLFRQSSEEARVCPFDLDVRLTQA